MYKTFAARTSLGHGRRAFASQCYDLRGIFVFTLADAESDGHGLSEASTASPFSQTPLPPPYDVP